jgi:hypothetical protein
MSLGWTLPYCQTSHLVGIKRGYQVTLVEWPDGVHMQAEVAVYEGLRTLCEKLGTLEECRAWAEQKARDLGIVELAECGCAYIELNYGKGHAVKRVPRCQAPAAGPCAGTGNA